MTFEDLQVLAAEYGYLLVRDDVQEVEQLLAALKIREALSVGDTPDS